jgi:sugar lactone lactonase YvrE
MLTRASGVAVAPDGTIWIVDARLDSTLNLLLHVGADGNISDVAAGLYGPEGVAVGPDGHVYVADRGAYRVASPNDSGGAVSFAGIEFRAGFTGDGGLAKKAKLWLPYDVAVDAASNVYISDTGNERIRVVDGETLKIQTIAGTGVAGYGGDGGQALQAQISDARGLAVDSAGTVLLIADYGNSRLRRIDLATGIITTIAGNGGGALNYSPALTSLQTPLTHLLSVAIDAAGNAYFPVFYADLGLTIMRLDSVGVMTRVAGGGQLSDAGVPALDFALSDVVGMAIDRATGDLYICAYGGKVYRVAGAAAVAGP